MLIRPRRQRLVQRVRLLAAEDRRIGRADEFPRALRRATRRHRVLQPDDLDRLRRRRRRRGFEKRNRGVFLLVRRRPAERGPVDVLDELFELRLHRLRVD